MRGRRRRCATAQQTVLRAAAVLATMSRHDSRSVAVDKADAKTPDVVITKKTASKGRSGRGVDRLAIVRAQRFAARRNA